MKTLAISLALGMSATIATAQSEKSTDTKAKGSIHDFATIPEGKVLPENVVRARLGYSTVTGNGDAYDKDGKKVSAPVDVKATGGALVIEYGISNKLSFQFQQDFVGSYEQSANTSSDAFASLKGDAFADNASGARNATQMVQGIASQLAANSNTRQAFCGAASESDCLTAILNGTAKNNATQAIAVGEASIPAGANVKQVLDAYAQAVDARIEDAIKDKTKAQGGEGLADTTIGVLYELFDTDWMAFSIGGGVRVPSGNRDRGLYERKTGRGLTEFGARWNADYLPSEYVRISWQNYSEAMLAKGKFKQAGQDVTIAREGVRNHGFLVVKPSLAGIAEPLKMFGPKFGVAYDFDSEERIKVGTGKESSVNGRGEELKYVGNLTANFFDFGLPLQAEFEYKKSFKGKNIAAATDNFTAQLKGYYKF